ncbi:hypothetical protein HYU13_01425 [Candidatus Woesearchaeota archaeon]|nr:hypothetical protein [Candidatus Woesearchaeota archaeon]
MGLLEDSVRQTPISGKSRDESSRDDLSRDKPYSDRPYSDKPYSDRPPLDEQHLFIPVSHHSEPAHFGHDYKTKPPSYDLVLESEVDGGTLQAYQNAKSFAFALVPYEYARGIRQFPSQELVISRDGKIIDWGIRIGREGSRKESFRNRVTINHSLREHWGKLPSFMWPAVRNYLSGSDVMEMIVRKNRGVKPHAKRGMHYHPFDLSKN